MIGGDASLNGQNLHAGDGAAVSEEDSMTLIAKTETELLLFDLA